MIQVAGGHCGIDTKQDGAGTPNAMKTCRSKQTGTERKRNGW